DERDGEPAVVELGDREARSLDGDRALLDDVAEKLGRRVDPEAASVALGRGGADGAAAVDVPLHVVPAERLARAERRLDVDARAGLEPRERGARERLGNGVEGDAAAVHGDCRQAAAVDSDGIADGEAGGRRRRLDLEPDPGIAALDADDAPDLADDP